MFHWLHVSVQLIFIGLESAAESLELFEGEAENVLFELLILSLGWIVSIHHDREKNLVNSDF